MEERIKELYQSGKGLKAISKELDIPPATIRRRLIAMGVYEGVGRYREEEDTDEGEELGPPPGAVGGKGR